MVAWPGASASTWPTPPRPPVTQVGPALAERDGVVVWVAGRRADPGSVSAARRHGGRRRAAPSPSTSSTIAATVVLGVDIDRRGWSTFGYSRAPTSTTPSAMASAGRVARAIGRRAPSAGRRSSGPAPGAAPSVADRRRGVGEPPLRPPRRSGRAPVGATSTTPAQVGVDVVQRRRRQRSCTRQLAAAAARRRRQRSTSSPLVADDQPPAALGGRVVRRGSGRPATHGTVQQAWSRSSMRVGAADAAPVAAAETGAATCGAARARSSSARAGTGTSGRRRRRAGRRRTGRGRRRRRPPTGGRTPAACTPCRRSRGRGGAARGSRRRVGDRPAGERRQRLSRVRARRARVASRRRPCGRSRRTAPSPRVWSTQYCGLGRLLRRDPRAGEVRRVGDLSAGCSVDGAARPR